MSELEAHAELYDKILDLCSGRKTDEVKSALCNVLANVIITCNYEKDFQYAIFEVQQGISQIIDGNKKTEAEP